MQSPFQREMAEVRESLVRMASMVEEQIDASLAALRTRDLTAANHVRSADQAINELHRQVRERMFLLIANQAPAAADVRTLMGLQYISIELERIGDYAVRIARMTATLCGLPAAPIRAEFGLMGELAIQQVRDILDALIEGDEQKAREVAARDDEIDRMYHRVFDDLIEEMGSQAVGSEGALRIVTLLLVAHNLERIADRVTNVAEDIVFLQTGQVVELG